ncbi:MAG: hypothetical protein AAFP84_07050 [Actinomycetota bacterium]
MGEAVDYVLATATPDVVATVQWLEAEGASVTRERGGRHESFGNVLVEFALDDAILTITRDRGQWMLDVQSGQLERFDYDVINAAISGDHHWSRPKPAALPTQLPDGVSWRENVPVALDWLRTTHDARDHLARLQRRRAAQMSE